nr:MAK10-like protein [Tanacetum cinerariifolium]
MRGKNHIRTLGGYSKPSNEGYRNTIELPEGKNVVPLRLVQTDAHSTDFVKAISLSQDVPSTSDCRLIELKNQVQRLMEAHLAPKQPIQVNKISSSCEICNGPHDTEYCMENLKQPFVNYASSRTDEAEGKWFTSKPKQNNLGDTYNPS